MLPVSQGFLAAVAAPVRTTRARVRLEVLDSRAWADNSKRASSEASISRLSQVTNRIRQPVAALGTFEPGYWRLDGSRVLPPEPSELADVELGWWSGNLCDATGLFSPAETIEISCGAPYNAAGITVTFDPAAGEYATEFTLSIFDANDDLIHEEAVIGNDSATYRLERVLPQFQRVLLSVSRWVNGERRARVTEIDFGLIDDYGEDNLIELSLIKEMDPISETLPVSELRFKLDNIDRQFNILNPQGLHYFLQRRQRITVDLGVLVGAEVEYVRTGAYYLLDWKSDHGSMTASFTARDWLDVLSEDKYRRGTLQTITAYELAEAILQDAEVTNYSIDPALHNVQLSACVPIVSHREALRLVAEASGAVVRLDRQDRVVIERLAETLPMATIDLDNSWETPAISQEKLITAVSVESTGYRLRGQAEVYAGSMDVDGQEELWVEYNSPCQDHQVTITGGTLDSAEHYAYASRLVVSGSGLVEISITADELEATRSTYILKNNVPVAAGEQPQTLTVSNPLIGSQARAAAVAAWLLGEANKRLVYDSTWRQNPALECGDIVTIEDEFGENRAARITRQELEYAGYLSGKTRAKGGG